MQYATHAIAFVTAHVTFPFRELIPRNVTNSVIPVASHHTWSI